MKCKLKDFCTVINGRAYSQKELLDKGKYRVLRVGNFFSSDRWYFSDLELPAEKYCNKGDLLFAWACSFGPRIWNGEDRTIFHYHIWKLDIDSNIVDKMYLFYLLKISVDSMTAGTHGSVMMHITKSDMENFEFDIPTLEVQKKIAAILSALDEKIAINREINDNLQQQARTLYKSWFVDFEPFDKRMPDLWKIGKLKDVLCLRKEVLKAGKRTDLCYLPIDAIPMNTFALTATRPNEEAQSSLLAFYCDDIIIGAMRVYFHRVIIAPFDGITRSTCFVLTPKDPNYLAFGLLCCDQDKSIDFAQQSSKGSTMPYAVWDGGLGELEIAIPPQDIAFEFNRIIMPMIREIQKSYYETEILNNIRDTLLPKLMSGEIDVSAVKL